MAVPKFLSYLPRFAYHSLPQWYFQIYKRKLLNSLKNYSNDYLNSRVNYYCKLESDQALSVSESIQIQSFKRGKGIHYYFDLLDFLKLFPKHLRFQYAFGDDLEYYPVPTIKKARMLSECGPNSILFKLNRNRHFQFYSDPYKWEEKQDKLVWRGAAYVEIRKQFVTQYYDHPRMNVGQTNRHVENVPWQVPKMSVQEQMQYKFIACPEGNDVATNLKWVLYSNSLCIMPKPTCESWFMEGMLEAGVHYAEVLPDFSNIEEVMDYYLQHPQEAKEIIQNAQKHAKQFLDLNREALICYLVLDRYFQFTQG